MIAFEQSTFPPAEGDHGIKSGLGLLLRVRQGRACWVLRYSFNGHRREMGLGRQPFTTPESLAAAQDEVVERAIELRRQIDLGRDPIAERDAERQGGYVARLRARNITVRRAMRLWADYEEPRRQWSKKHIQCVARTIEKETPHWLLDLPVVDLDAEMVVRAIESIRARGRKDLFRQRLSWCCEWLIDSGQIDANAAGILRIVRGRFASPSSETE